MVDVTDQKTGWNAWTPTLANEARTRYHARENRLTREERDNQERLAKKASAKLSALNAEPASSEVELAEQERKRKIIAAAIARAQKST